MTSDRLASLLRWTLALALAASAAPGARSETARSPQATDPSALKAAFLYNFAMYAAWPPPPPSAYTICAMGRDDLGASLDALTAKQIEGRPVHVRRVDGASDARGCHLLYVSESSGVNLPSTVRALQSQPVLIVSDAGGTASELPMIALESEGNRYAFSVNLGRVRAAGLDLSARLLRLAKVVR